ncbi:NERD domain-containing protein [Caballeronia grimmiae]|uniref:NERD domain-containing protein n=1 Tax=Caballeronia grimmiae TaxID=1071679 RepID=UPI0038BCF333
MSMQQQCPTCGYWHDAPFIPTRAVLGHPKGNPRDTKLEEGQRRIEAFTRKLGDVMSSLAAGHAHIVQQLTVLTSQGITGLVAQADFVVVTGIGVFVISRMECDGFVSRGEDQHSLVVQDATGDIRRYRSPLRCTMAVVGFLRALFADFPCPIEALAVFDDERCTLARGLPTSIVTTEELEHFFRIRRDAAYCKGWNLERSKMTDLLLSACK